MNSLASSPVHSSTHRGSRAITIALLMAISPFTFCSCASISQRFNRPHRIVDRASSMEYFREKMAEIDEATKNIVFAPLRAEKSAVSTNVTVEAAAVKIAAK